jgi:hypothetical protein
VAKRFRDLAKFKLPAWWLEGDGGAITDSVISFLDIAAQKARDGLTARMPRTAGPSALALIEDERMILRGRSETDAAYAERLTQWRTGRHSHKARGTAWALLNQICEYVGGARCYTLDASREVFQRGSVGRPGDPGSLVYSRDAESTYDDYQPTFIWDSLDPNVHWSRFWVVLCANPQLPWVAGAPNFGNAALWGGAVGTPGYCVGLTGWTPADTLAIRKLFRGKHPWRPGGTQPEWLIIQLTDWEAGNDVQTDGSGYHEHWSRNDAGTQVPTRNAAHRYLSLSPDVNNAYAGDPTLFATDVTTAGGALYDGDPTSFPTSVVLPSGAAYAGNPATFSARVQLVDDGDQT